MPTVDKLYFLHIKGGFSSYIKFANLVDSCFYETGSNLLQNCLQIECKPESCSIFTGNNSIDAILILCMRNPLKNGEMSAVAVAKPKNYAFEKNPSQLKIHGNSVPQFNKMIRNTEKAPRKLCRRQAHFNRGCCDLEKFPAWALKSSSPTLTHCQPLPLLV